MPRASWAARALIRSSASATARATATVAARSPVTMRESVENGTSAARESARRVHGASVTARASGFRFYRQNGYPVEEPNASIISPRNL